MAHETELISTSISANPSLPDFLALLRAEIASAEEASNERSRVKPSPLGAGELILAARELTGLSQRQLAARLRTSQPAIAVVESGNRIPTVRTLLRAFGAMGFELVVGFRSPGSSSAVALGALVANEDDGLADYHPLGTPSPFQGPGGN
jgi:transcriptional regulator with XRE-family HTH domain